MAAIKILTAPLGAPISLARVKCQLRLDEADDTEDDYLLDLIGAAIERAQLLTNRLFCTQTVREFRHHFPSSHLNQRLFHPHEQQYLCDHHDSRVWELMRSPVSSIVQIQYVDQTGTQQTLDPSLYNSDLDLEPGTLYPAPYTYWPITQHGVPNQVWVDYIVGYSEDDSLVPRTLKGAMAQMVAHWYTNREPVQEAGVAELPMFVTDLIALNKIRYQP